MTVTLRRTSQSCPQRRRKPPRTKTTASVHRTFIIARSIRDRCQSPTAHRLFGGRLFMKFAFLKDLDIRLVDGLLFAAFLPSRLVHTGTSPVAHTATCAVDHRHTHSALVERVTNARRLTSRRLAPVGRKEGRTNTASQQQAAPSSSTFFCCDGRAEWRGCKEPSATAESGCRPLPFLGGMMSFVQQRTRGWRGAGRLRLERLRR